MAALISLGMNPNPNSWGDKPPEFPGPNGTNGRGTQQVVFLQAPNNDRSFTMNGKPLFTINNPNNTHIR